MDGEWQFPMSLTLSCQELVYVIVSVIFLNFFFNLADVLAVDDKKSDFQYMRCLLEAA